jgi:hypothetical protein
VTHVRDSRGDPLGADARVSHRRVGVTSGIQRRLAPVDGATLLTGAAIASAGAVVLALGAIGFAYLAEVPWMADTLGWCRGLSPIDDHVPTVLGVGTLVALVVSGIRGFAYLRVATWRSSTAPPEIGSCNRRLWKPLRYPATRAASWCRRQ